MCKNILINMLAEDDEIIIINHLNLFGLIIGDNITLISLFYNIFLIKNINPFVKNYLLNIYLCLMENNSV
jgi:hypothetical protein